MQEHDYRIVKVGSKKWAVIDGRREVEWGTVGKCIDFVRQQTGHRKVKLAQD